MIRLLRKWSLSIGAETALSVLFFLLYYLYLQLVVDLRLIYHNGGIVLDFPVFYRGWEFFRSFLSYPGGPIDYTSAFLAQFFYIGWAGALVATVQAWLLWVLASSIMRAACGRSYKVVCFAFPVLLLGYYAKYTYPFGVAMTVLAAMCFVRLYLAAAMSESRITVLAVFLVLSVILFAIAGAGYLLFAAVCGLYELLFRRRPALGLAILSGGLIAAHIEGTVLFDFSITRIFNYLAPSSYRGYKIMFGVVCVLYLLLPLILAGAALGQLLPARCYGRLNRITAYLAVKFRALSPLHAIIAAAMVAYFCYSAELKATVATSYYICNGMWREAIETAGRYPQSILMNHSADFAFYHKGVLAEDIFKYRQLPGALMLSNETEKPEVWWRIFDTYIDLGYMNLAESMLVLCMDTFGERPVILKRLALINMVKGNIGAAKVYLGALSKTLFDAGWARAYLEEIDADPNLSKDKDIQRLRGIMPTIDRNFADVDESVFLDLLARNRHNKMAFEYLAAYYLLTTQLNKFTEILGRLDDFDYKGIPRTYEEAILLYSHITKKKIETGGREISRQSVERFNGFKNIYIGRYGANKKSAFNELEGNYSDSYFFYYVYGQSGMKK